MATLLSCLTGGHAKQRSPLTGTDNSESGADRQRFQQGLPGRGRQDCRPWGGGVMGSADGAVDPGVGPLVAHDVEFVRRRPHQILSNHPLRGMKIV